MRIVHLAAGAGGMYCGACARDTLLARVLIAQGHDFQIIPLYTPLRFDGGDPLPTARIFLGGINAYIEQQLPLWRYVPRGLRGMLDTPRVLAWASRFAVSTKPGDLGPMMLSVLQGVNGRQAAEFADLVRYIGSIARPDLVSITNSLLTGVAPEIKRKLGIPIVCGLQGEDTFVKATPEPYRSRTIEQMRANAASVDLFLSPSHTYAATMADFLRVPTERIRVARVGVDAEPYRRDARTRPFPFCIGYLGVITPLKGLDLLVRAFIALRKRGANVELAVAGKVLNRQYWVEQVRRLEGAGVSQHVRYEGELPFSEKVSFLHGCSAFCIPSRQPETRAVAALEAQAAGLPVIVPDTGIFPEMLEITRGGLTFPTGDSEGIAEAVAELMRDPEAAARMGQSAAERVRSQFSPERLARETLAAFEDAVRAQVSGSSPLADTGA